MLGPKTNLALHHQHRPFFLYPDMPAQPDGDYHLPLTWGERLFAIGSNTQYLDVLSEKAGLKFNFNAMGSNTLDSHRLLLFAEHVDEQKLKSSQNSNDKEREKGINFALALRLNFATKYFTEGKRLADHSVLLDGVKEVGLDEEEAKAILSSDKYKEDVLESARNLQREGIHSIPVFFFRSGEFRATIHGSSDRQKFLQVFKAAETYWKELDAKNNTCSDA